MTYLMLLFSILYFFLAWRRLDLSVMLLIAALPSYLIRFQVFGIPMTVLETMILISFTVWLLKSYKQIIENLKLKIRNCLKIENCKLKIINYPFGWELSLLILIAWISAIVSGFSNEALGIWKAYFFEPALLFVVVMNVFKPSTDKGNTSTYRLPQEDTVIASEAKQSKEGGEQPQNYHGFRPRNDNLGKIIFSLSISAFVVSVLALYQKIAGNLIDNPLWAAAETRRVVSFFGYPNAVGLYLGPIALMLIGYFFSVIARFAVARRGNPEANASGARLLQSLSLFRNDKFKIVYIGLAIFISLLSIYFAKSEGALIGIAAALFVFGILAGGKMRWATIIGTVVIGASLMAYQPTRYLLEDKILFRDFSGQVRRQQWKETWQMLASSPTKFIFGTGLANYQSVIKPFHQEGIFVRDYRDPNWRRMVVFNDEFKKKVWRPVEIYLYPHNIFLNFWTELGLVGMLLFIWIFIKFFVIGFWGFIGNWKLEIGNLDKTKYKFLIVGLTCSMVVMIVHGLVDVPYFKNDLAALFWIYIAMAGLLTLPARRNA